MPTQTKYWLNAAGTLWKRPGYISLDAGSFVEFAVGAVEPVGTLDGGSRNVGVRVPEGDLEVVNGDVTLTPGMLVQGKDIRGRVLGRGDATTLVQDCIVRGLDKPTSQSYGARGNSGDFGGTTFKFCRFDATGRESGFTSGIEGGGYSMKYCEVMRFVDGIGANSFGNATIENNRIYAGYYMSWWNDVAAAVRTATFNDFGGATFTAPFPAQSSGDVHGDAVQIQGGSGWVIRGNNFGGIRGTMSAVSSNLDPTVSSDYDIVRAYDLDLAFKNSVLMVNGNASSPIGLLFEYNTLAGGVARVNLADATPDLLAGVTIQHNKFVRMSTYPGSYAIVGDTATPTMSDNVFSDTGLPVPIGFSAA